MKMVMCSPAAAAARRLGKQAPGRLGRSGRCGAGRCRGAPLEQGRHRPVPTPSESWSRGRYFTYVARVAGLGMTVPQYYQLALLCAYLPNRCIL
jgi:hypothetical protein